MHFAANYSVLSTALESCRRFKKRTEFCEFLACPEFLVNWHFTGITRAEPWSWLYRCVRKMSVMVYRDFARYRAALL